MQLKEVYALGLSSIFFIHKSKSRPQAAFVRLISKKIYGITPAGACGIAPAVVAAAASFKIL
jgi:hypothetical protein